MRNLLQVTIRDIERAGVLLDRLVEAGANEVRGIRFTLQDDTQMALQAPSPGSGGCPSDSPAPG